MVTLGGKEQATAINSLRRKMERQTRKRVTAIEAVHRWIGSGLSRLWRQNFNKAHHNECEH
jgi:hypothetical protein